MGALRLLPTDRGQRVAVGGVAEPDVFLVCCSVTVGCSTGLVHRDRFGVHTGAVGVQDDLVFLVGDRRPGPGIAAVVSSVIGSCCTPDLFVGDRDPAPIALR